MGAGAISWSVIVFLTLVTLGSAGYMAIFTLSIIISTHWPNSWEGEWMIVTHHILDGGTREKAIKETVPVPEDMGEDEVPDGHSCQEIVGTQEQENWRYKKWRYKFFWDIKKLEI